MELLKYVSVSFTSYLNVLVALSLIKKQLKHSKQQSTKIHDSLTLTVDNYFLRNITSTDIYGTKEEVLSRY